MEEKIFFSSIKEGRGKYFVEYKPPLHGYRFATLHLVFPDEIALDDVVTGVENEGTLWFSRYPVPLMVSTFGPSGNLLDLKRVRQESHCMIYSDPGSSQIKTIWRLLKNEELPQEVLNRDRLLEIYSGVPHRTSKEIEADAKEHVQSMRVGWYAVFLWVVVGPTAFLVLEYFGPQWLATVIFLYGLYRATVKAFKMTGRWKKSKAEFVEEEEDRLMRHHHYHCMRNPEAFLRLKVENFEREAGEEARRELESLGNTSKQVDRIK
jgi:hypothetical protein